MRGGVKHHRGNQSHPAESESEDEVSVGKGGFFSGWFGAESVDPSDTRDDSFSSCSEESDSIADDYPYAKNNGEREQPEDSRDDDMDSEDEASLIDFDRNLRSRHAQACKYMRVSVLLMSPVLWWIQ